jgi:hypothetical protein
MKKIAALLIVGLAITPAYLSAQSQDEMEITQLIMDGNDQVNADNVALAGDYSQHGALEFWSSGGLLQEIPAGGRRTEFESINTHAKHIQVISLVEGQAAIAHFYSEGSMTPKGGTAVSNYLTRVTQAYVKENGEWKLRSAHWSAVKGGGGTTQTALQN